MIPLGVSAEVSTTESQNNYDFMDLNGDGLLDMISRVSESGGGLRVSLNLGYRFAPEEIWDLADSSITSSHSCASALEANLGFNSGIFDFAGGASPRSRRFA